MTTRTDHDRYELLLVKAVDGQLGPEERARLDEHLKTCARCREELGDFLAIKKTTDAMTERILADARLEPPREAPATRALMRSGFLLILAGLALLVGFAGYQLFSDPAAPLAVKAGTGAVGLGALAVLAHLLWRRLHGAGKDPYREIDQ